MSKADPSTCHKDELEHKDMRIIIASNQLMEHLIPPFANVRILIAEGYDVLGVCGSVYANAPGTG